MADSADRVDRAEAGDGPGAWQFDHRPGNESEVEVFVRAAGWPERAAAIEPLSLRGPFCDLTRMLPAAYRLQPFAPGVWHTAVVDPCYWTPLSPAYYRLETREAAEGAAVRGTADPGTIVGLRRLEVRGAHLVLDGRRWVFRAARADPGTFDRIDAWHESLLGLVVDAPDERLLEAASRRGVPVMIQLDDSTVAARLWQAARWPAVQMALLPATASNAADELATRAPNLLRTAHLSPGDTTIPDWAHAVLCEVDDRRSFEAMLRADGRRRPLLVAQPQALQWNAASDRDPAHLRRACERLQEQLAGWDISGFLV